MATLDLSPGKLNFKAKKGGTFRPVLTVRDANNALMDFTSYTARMQIRATVDGATVLHELTTENGGITLGGAAGTITLRITDVDTTAFAWDSAVYDLELIEPGGDVVSFLEGSVVFKDEVTR